ncbi:ribosomal protein S6 modification protein [Pokkaliibacter plantistimulans]|uniref:Ribosomal protein S6 modification protein n=2 Tax=Pseudomonadota TaxID=1224 RepID=A0ABX5LZ89_9GAMM|nr:ATP-dependent zinc protease [Pokkaliibacter plantistimulans]PPC78582.1 ATP-dependent zinc protease [Pokkaliibacter plantistimulans]PXF31944.1 ribosomal protein S6 modification protein [Pokkaliibacter plantistimulans]
MTQSNTLGWYEWVSLPELGLPAIKAKVDTGARTSCLHTYRVEPFNRDGEPWIRFHVHPLQHNSDTSICCEAKVKEQRQVRDSGGHTTLRYVIETTISLGTLLHQVEITLTARDDMQFRMLLGRTSIPRGCVVDPHRSRLMSGKPASKKKSKKAES